MTPIEAVMYGTIGGALPEFLAIYNLRASEKPKPYWLTSGFYWCITVVMILLGGGTVLLYQKVGINMNEYIAIHLGMSTPVLISTVAKEKPKINPLDLKL